MIEIYIKDKMGVSKMVGKIEDDSYVTRRSAKSHFYRKGQGYPISISILKELRKRKVKWVVIIEIDRVDDKEVVYRCYTSDYDNVGSFQEDGFDEQKCIPLRKMDRLEDDSSDEATWSAEIE